MAQSRRFCITIFSSEQGKKPHKPVCPEFVDFFTGQRERCPTTGKRHYQCYFETSKKVRLGSIIEQFRDHLGHHNFHIEVARGTQKQNIDYCSKTETSDGKHFFFGDPMNQGRRNDLLEIADAIKSNVTELEIFDKNPHWFFNQKYMDKLIQVKNSIFKNKLRDIEVYYIYGPPGCGKSQFVWEQLDGRSYYQPPPMKNKHLWFDGYIGQDILWLEDVNLEEWDRSLVLRLFDRYPLSCEIKGGTTQACWTKVYITSNFEPEYLDDAIQRRFTEIVPMELTQSPIETLSSCSTQSQTWDTSLGMIDLYE